MKNKPINGQYQFLCDRTLRITWRRQNRKSWSRVRIPWHGLIFHLHLTWAQYWVRAYNKNRADEEKYLYIYFKEESIIYIWPNFSSIHSCLIAIFCWQNLNSDIGSDAGRWFRVLFLPGNSLYHWTRVTKTLNLGRALSIKRLQNFLRSIKYLLFSTSLCPSVCSLSPLYKTGRSLVIFDLIARSLLKNYIEGSVLVENGGWGTC